MDDDDFDDDFREMLGEPDPLGALIFFAVIVILLASCS